MRGLERVQAVWQEWRVEGRRERRSKSGSARACPCCGSLTLEGDEGDYDICPVCFWEDDPVQLRDPNYEGGANAVSLEQARRNYRRYGVSEERFKDDVRRRTPEEQPRENS
jgi:Cysteine-rich CPCC